MKSIKITNVSMLIALSIVAGYFIHFPILPQAPFLLYDPGNVFLLIGSFKLGQKIGVLMCFITVILFALITGQGGPYGALMNFVVFPGSDYMYMVNDPLELNIGIPYQLILLTILVVYTFIFYVPSLIKLIVSKHKNRKLKVS